MSLESFEPTLPPPDDVPPAPFVPLAHTIKGGKLASIAFGNALLTVITLGIWSFWAKTRIRRYLWSNIQVDGDALHYTGTGFELFKGAIIATLVLMALFIPMGFVSAAGYPEIAGYAQGFLFILLTPIGLFFARRYRFSRTEWRGIRAGFTGALKPFFVRVVGWTLLSALTLGFTEPFRQVYMERYFWNNSYIGSMKFSSTLTVKKTGYLYWIGWFLFFFPIFGGIALVYYTSGGNSEVYLNIQKLIEEQARALGGGFLLIGPFVIIGLVLTLLFRVRLLRASLSSLSLGGVTIISSFSLWRAFKIGFGVVFMFTVPTGLLVFFGFAIAKGIGDWAVILLAIAAPFLLIGGSAALWAKLWTARFNAAMIETLHLAGTLDVAAIRQSDLTAPNRGEGLLGAVDIGL